MVNPISFNFDGANRGRKLSGGATDAFVEIGNKVAVLDRVATYIRDAFRTHGQPDGNTLICYPYKEGLHRPLDLLSLLKRDLDLVGTGNDEAFDRLREYFDTVTTPTSNPSSKEIAKSLLTRLIKLAEQKEPLFEFVIPSN